jgi:hypothetical protein
MGTKEGVSSEDSMSLSMERNISAYLWLGRKQALQIVDFTVVQSTTSLWILSFIKILQSVHVRLSTIPLNVVWSKDTVR